MKQDCLYLRRLKKHGNFTKAAASLGVSQPYFSQRIARMEKAYRVPLVDRHTVPITLTQAGELVLATEQRVHELREDCSKKILDLQAGLRGDVAIGVTAYSGEFFLPQALPMLQRHCPEISLTVLEGDERSLHRFASEGRVDFSLLLEGKAPPGLETIPVHEEETLLALPAAAPEFAPLLARPRSRAISFSELDGRPFIASDEGSFLGERFTDLCRITGAKPRVLMRTGSPSAAAALCAAGAGAALTTGTVARGHVSAAGIAFFPVSPRLGEPEFCAVYRNDRYLSQAALAVVSVFQKAREDASWSR